SPRPPNSTLFPYTTLFRSTAKKYDLRPGVGIAAPQLNVSKKMLAVHIPPELEGADPFSLVMINPRIISHSVQRTALQDGEGCLRSEEHTSELQSRFDLVCR